MRTTYHMTRVSQNSKTGPIPVTTTSNNTCPLSCPLRARGCYAKNGPIGLHWRRVSSGIGVTLSQLCAAIRKLPAGQLWRHNQAGDLPGEGDNLDARGLALLVSANTGRRGFSYTHKPMTDRNADLVREANRRGFTINLSADSLTEADELYDKRAGPVVVVLASTVKGRTEIETPKGRPVVVCPATYMEGKTCDTCQLCAWADREVIIGFPAHGSGKKYIDQLELL